MRALGFSNCDPFLDRLAGGPASTGGGESCDADRFTGDLLPNDSLLSVSDAIRTKRLTSSEVTRVLLDRIASANETSRSYATVTAQHAMRMGDRSMWRSERSGTEPA